MPAEKKTYYKPFGDEDCEMRMKLRAMLSEMETDTSHVENVVTKFESKIEEIMDRINSLEARVSRIEEKLGLL